MEGKCIICNRYTDIEKHEPIGGCRRKLSVRFGLSIPVCRLCHGELQRSKVKNYPWQQAMQKLFMKRYPELDWMAIFQKNYL